MEPPALAGDDTGTRMVLEAAAEWVSLEEVRCVPPIAMHPATVAVAATNDGAHDGASAVQYTYFDPNAPSVATAVAPAYTQYDGDGADVAIYGRNFAPTGELLRVRYGGRAVAATFVSSSEVRARFGSSPEDATSARRRAGHLLSVPVEVTAAGEFSGGAGAGPLHLDDERGPSHRFSLAARACYEEARRCDLRTGGVLSVDDKAIDVRGWNFAPTASLTCVFRYENTNGGVFSTMVGVGSPRTLWRPTTSGAPSRSQFADAGVASTRCTISRRRRRHLSVFEPRSVPRRLPPSP